MLPVRRNLSLFKWNNFFMYLWPLSAVGIIYAQSITGSYAAAALFFSIYVMVQSLAELPTGIMSDKWSRRKTMIVSGVLYIASSMCIALAGNFNNIWILYSGAVFWGISEAFRSGTDDALMYETMTDLRMKPKYDIVFSSAKIWRYSGAAVATFVAVPVLYFFNMNTLAWICLIPNIGQLIVSSMFIEPKSFHKNDLGSMRHFLAALKNFRHNKNLRRIAVGQIISESWGEANYRINSIYANAFVPIWAIDIVVFFSRVFSAIGFYIAMQMRKIGLLKMALVSQVYKFIVMAIGLAFNNFLSPWTLSAIFLGSGGERTAENALLQNEFSDEMRATMMSIVSIFGGILTAACFWFFGLVADKWSIYIALLSLLAYKGLVVLYWWGLKQGISNLSNR